MVFGANRSFGALESDLAVRAVAEWSVHGAATAAKRKRRFARQVVLVAIGIDQFQPYVASLPLKQFVLLPPKKVRALAPFRIAS